MQIDWEIEYLTVRHAKTPQAINNEISTVDFVMHNTYATFRSNPLEVSDPRNSAINAE